MIFSNARLVLPDGIHDGLEVVVENGKIAEIRKRSSAEAIDLDGNYLAPGFIDLHIHGAVGRDTMEASPEAFQAICDYHATGGTTSLLLTTATAPIPEIVDVLRAVQDLPALNSSKSPACTWKDHSSRESAPGRNARNSSGIRSRRSCSSCSNSPMSSNASRSLRNLPGALEAIDRLRAQNIAVSGGHSDAWDEEARDAFEHGMRHVTHTFNCMSSMHRRNGERVAGLLEFALSEPEIMCELIADGHHVSNTLMKMLYRAKGRDGHLPGDRCDGRCRVCRRRAVLLWRAPIAW